MKQLHLLVLFLAVLVLPASGQDVDIKYWVFFRDKPDVAAKTVPIAERAVERRERRAEVSRPELDRPVSDAYVTRLKDTGAVLHHGSRWLNAVSATMSAETARTVSEWSFVREVAPVGVLRKPAGDIARTQPIFGPEAPAGPAAFRLDYGKSYTQLNIMKAISGLEAGLSGQGVLLGVMDTYAGDLNHPAVGHIIAGSRLVGQENFTPFPDTNDPSRHALSVLSVAAGFDPGKLIGPAYGADIILAHTEYSPTETNQEEDAFVAGLEWMESQGVDVVNVSLGYSTFDPGQRQYTYSDMDGDTAITTRAADMAVGLGVVMVNSAGNEGGGAWYYITSPADGDSVLAIGAVSSTGTRASFSGHGPSSDGRIKPDVSAMGVGVMAASPSGAYYTDNNGNPTANGTSFSSPLVAGVVAQMLEVNPSLKPMEIRAMLTSTASLAANPNNDLGYGVINAEAALNLARASVGTRSPEIPGAEILTSIFPNPTSGPPTLHVVLPEAGPVRMEVVDALGRVVRRMAWPMLSSGPHDLLLELPGGSAGWFGYRVTTSAGQASGTFTRSH